MTGSLAGSTAPMRLDEALASIRTRLSPVAEVESVPLAEALGRVLAADQVAAVTVPPFDNSAMDGWAVRAADLGGGALPVGGRIAAGHPLAEPVLPGHAYRIFTGAPVPPGLDTVIMQEEARANSDAVALPVAPVGAKIRKAGESVAPGDVVLTAGTLLRPQHLGVAATLGLSALPVRRRLRVAIFSTGDELHELGTAMSAGGLYDANRASLLAMLQGLGCTVSNLGILADCPAILREALAQAAPAYDLIITSGGVSVGEEDLRRQFGTSAVLLTIGVGEAALGLFHGMDSARSIQSIALPPVRRQWSGTTAFPTRRRTKYFIWPQFCWLKGTERLTSS